jgi:hypothetical protein
MSVVRWLNDRDKEKPRNSEINVFQCHFFRHVLYVIWHKTETKPRRWKADQ